MTVETINFECITPCFCAGADQTKAEIRPSAIRGALRWWFRCLGGTAEQEIQVFGGVDPVRSSSIQIRVSNVSPRDVGALPSPPSMSPKAYILHFASIAGGSSSNFGSGPRWNNTGCLGTGTTFDLHLRQLRNIPIESLDLLEKAVTAFKHYGSIGMRITRGMGAVQASDANADSFAYIDETLQNHGFTIKRSNKTHQIWDAVLEEAGKWLKNDLRKEFGAGGNKKSALGSIAPVRQTSAVYLRPIKLNGALMFSAFEAPHEKVLGEASKRLHSGPVLASRDFTQPAPVDKPQHRSR